jgi:hypothetical protein
VDAALVVQGVVWRWIGEQHPELGKHVAWAVRTGTFCSYGPDE